MTEKEVVDLYKDEIKLTKSAFIDSGNLQWRIPRFMIQGQPFQVDFSFTDKGLQRVFLMCLDPTEEPERYYANLRLALEDSMASQRSKHQTRLYGWTPGRSKQVRSEHFFHRTYQ